MICGKSRTVKILKAVTVIVVALLYCAKSYPITKIQISQYQGSGLWSTPIPNSHSYHPRPKGYHSERFI